MAISQTLPLHVYPERATCKHCGGSDLVSRLKVIHYMVMMLNFSFPCVIIDIISRVF